MGSKAALSAGYGSGPAPSATGSATSRNGFSAFSAWSIGPAQWTTASARVSPWRFSGMKGSGGAEGWGGVVEAAPVGPPAGAGGLGLRVHRTGRHRPGVDDPPAVVGAEAGGVVAPPRTDRSSPFSRA